MRVRERCPDCGAKLDHVDRTRAPWIRVLDRPWEEWYGSI